MNDDKMWEAVVNCDASYDGKFYYGVKTTGIYCRPSCKSKLPKRGNVVFFKKMQKMLDFVHANVVVRICCSMIQLLNYPKEPRNYLTIISTIE